MNFSISVVSHGSGKLLSGLLSDLKTTLPPDCEIVVTLNIKEDESYLAPHKDLPLTILRNPRPLGFGNNHNQAFRRCTGRYFVVVNPDVRLPNSPFGALEHAMGEAQIGACAPVVVSPNGSMEDSVRRFPTVASLAKRVLLRRRHPDFMPVGQGSRPVDWAAGMFVAFARDAFLAVGGFDTRYFMYFEDADICRRLWANGWKVLLVSEARVVHDARRASHRSVRHLGWHVRSALRFLLGV